MPKIRDWSYNYTTVAGTSVVCDAPDSALDDLLLAVITCKTAPNTVSPPAPVGNFFAKVLTERPAVAAASTVFMTNNTTTGLGGDGTCNVTGTTPYTVTGVGKTTTLAANNAFAGRLYPNTTAATPLAVSVYTDVFAGDMDISGISIATALRGVAATDTVRMELYSYDPAGAAGNGTLVASAAAKTLTGGTTTTAYTWVAGDFTISGTGRVTAGHRLQWRWYWYSATTASTARIMFGTTGTTTSTSMTFTATPAGGGGGLVFSDITTAAGDGTAGDWSPVSALTTTINEAVYLGHSATFTQLSLYLSVAGAGGSSASAWEYWNGSAWAALTTTTDTTASWRAPTTASVVFTAPGNWSQTAVNGSTLYWIRSRVTTAGTFTTRPMGTAVNEGAGLPWTQHYNVVSGTTPAQVVFWRKARAVEDASFTFTMTSSIVNITMLSIRGADVTTPFDGYSTATTTGQKTALPVRATTVADCLNLHLVSMANTGIPAILDGAVAMLYAKDGTTLSDGCGWSYTKSPSNTPACNVTHVGTTTNAMVRATISIRPSPTANVVPPYCAGDASVYLDPINGTTAFNGNTAFAATGTTYFSTTLNTTTLANATVTARADVGLNSYHSMGDVGSATTPVKGNWYGATTVFATANRPNVTGKNVLLHTKPYLPVDLQTTTNITSTGKAKGVAIGMVSTSTSAFKVFHVSGAQTPWAANYQPVVMNDGYSGAGAIDNRGTLNPAAVTALGYFVSGFVAQPNWMFGSAWVLDTTIVAGGSAAEPVRPADLIVAAAEGHERMSVTRQGSNQVLVFQPIQFGDGGTNPINLDFAYSATEFPEQYNQDKKITNYCAPDNVCGYTIYAGASDSISFAGAVLSSPSPYHFRIHASSSALAAYNFTGATFIGAGECILRPVTTFSGVSFTRCADVTQNGATLTSCTFSSSTLTCTDLTGLALVSNSAFASSGTGYAIDVGGVAGTITLNGNTFNGYAATNGTTGNEAIFVNIATGTVTINIAGGGSTPSIRTAGATVNVVSGATVTFTGLPTGTDVVILTAGTSTILSQIDSNPSSTYAWSYQGTPTVDVGFIKTGYVVQYIRGLTLGTSDSNIPVSLSLDRNYS